MLATVSLLLGIALLVAAVYGLAGLWWALAATGLALVAFAVLDERGRQQEKQPLRSVPDVRDEETA